MNDRRKKRKPGGSGKRPYHRPRLLVYGDVNSLTRAKDFMSATRDGAIGMWLGFDIPLRS